MRTATLVPKLTDGVTVFLVLNDFGPLGRAYVETDEAKASERDVISDISSGQHSKPIRVVAFNTSEGWSRDVTEDIAEALLERDASENDLSESAKTFFGRVLKTATWARFNCSNIPATWVACPVRNADVRANTESRN